MLVKDKIVLGRHKLGISTPKLAQLIDVNQGTINRYETGAIKTIPIDKLRKLSEVLGYPFDEFIAGDPKYSGYEGSVSSLMQQSSLNLEESSLLNWYRSLPIEYQSVMQQLIAVSVAKDRPE